MKVLVAEYAYATEFQPLINEGIAMLSTLVRDFEECGCEVEYLAPLRAKHLKWGRGVPCSDFERDFEQRLKYVDAALAIAPDDMLYQLNSVVEEYCVNLGCPPKSAGECADKRATYQVLKENNIPTPEPWKGKGMCVEKPRFGCGSEDVFISDCPSGEGWEFVGGMSMSVGCVVSDSCAIPLTLNLQRILMKPEGKGIRVEYIGNTVPYHHPKREESYEIAIKACKALGCRGYVGVDVVVGDDVWVVDVNPRPTTSIIGVSEVLERRVGELILRARVPEFIGGLEEIPQRLRTKGVFSFTKYELPSILASMFS
jgi:hypothetical protein